MRESAEAPTIMAATHWQNLSDITLAGKSKTAAIAGMFIFLLLSSLSLYSQNSSPDQQKQKHSPRKASIYSAILPGMGQAYNRKYWKIPIVYAGFGGLGYNIYFNRDYYKKFKEAYVYVINKDTFPINNEFVGRYNAQQLQTGRDYYRRNLELGYILAGVWHVLNIIDATVDAHFFNYDIGENLSLRVEPAFFTNPRRQGLASGISLTLKF